MVTRDEYKKLSANATIETAYFASFSQILKNTSVQTIIQMGVDVLPFLFQDLIDEEWGSHWQMLTISAILETNKLPPVKIPEKSRGTFKEMVFLFIKYGQRFNYIR